MCELNDKNLEQVAGGKANNFNELWEECLRKNCDGCAIASTCDRKSLRYHFLGALNAARKVGEVLIPVCHDRK